MNIGGNLQMLWSNHKLFKRVLMESFDAALVICNFELEEFTSAKLFDIVNQVLPTAFVLTTGYWPFFNTTKQQSLCVCGRYGFYCRHHKHQRHWIDLEPLQGDNSMKFSTKNRHLKIVESNIKVIPSNRGSAGYEVTIKLRFQYGKVSGGGRGRRSRIEENFNANLPEVAQVIISCRYGLQREHYPALRSLIFHLNPLFSDSYGRSLLNLQNERVNYNIQPPVYYKFGNMLVEVGQMSKFTLVLQHCDIPAYVYYNVPTNAIFVKIQASSFENMSIIETDVEVWRCKEMIANCRPIWNNGANNASLNNITEINYTIEDFVSQIPYLNYEESTNQVVELPRVQENNNFLFHLPALEYKAAPKRRNNRKKYQQVQTFGDTNSQTSLSVCQNSPFKFGKLENPQILATIAKTEIPEIKVKTEENKYEDLDLDFQWLDEQCPLPAITIKPEKLDEQQYPYDEKLLKDSGIIEIF